jgi:surface polysaccharide O-acyltransferase-like enzyme
MAITNLVPVFDRIGKPNFKIISGSLSVEKLHPRKFVILIISVFVACFLLQSVISTLVTSDAFALQELKHQRNLVQDQRDAILMKVNEKSSPDLLAAAAAKLGMKPVESISYLDMSK